MVIPCFLLCIPCAPARDIGTRNSHYEYQHDLYIIFKHCPYIPSHAHAQEMHAVIGDKCGFSGKGTKIRIKRAKFE